MAEATPALVAVTGASGHVGACLVRALLRQGRRVRAVINQSTAGIDGLPVEIVRADVRDAASLATAFADAGTVFHLAAKISLGREPPALVQQINVEGPRNVARACRTAGVRRLVHFSSIEAFAPVAGGTIDETCPSTEPGVRGRGIYGVTKAAGERGVREAIAAGLDAVIIYPTAIIGPYDYQVSAMGLVLRALAAGRMPALVAGASFDFVDVRDVAAAALAAEERGERGEGYLVTGTYLSFVELSRRWAKVTDRPAPRWAAPMWMASLAAPFAPIWAGLRGRRPLFTSDALRVLRTSCPVSRRKAEAGLGYKPRAIEETLRDTWEFLREEGSALPRLRPGSRTSARG
jgi:dihydroflavonol-4-reductase